MLELPIRFGSGVPNSLCECADDCSKVIITVMQPVFVCFSYFMVEVYDDLLEFVSRAVRSGVQFLST